ncbi:MAG: ribosome-associated protein YbcJ [Sodalis sp. (in: enterobacteria)]|uniref:ribosome-associated protein YbcJ n=1 Tax=Sodalis sp. (in: enterobacteria) TaxID=1898979 RepID=UPI0039E3B562
MTTFSLEGHPHIALCDLLKISGWCDSGAAAKLVIDEGRVTVNGEVESRRRCKITAGQRVAFAGQQVTIAE